VRFRRGKEADLSRREPGTGNRFFIPASTAGRWKFLTLPAPLIEEMGYVRRLKFGVGLRKSRYCQKPAQKFGFFYDHCLFPYDGRRRTTWDRGGLGRWLVQGLKFARQGSRARLVILANGILDDAEDGRSIAGMENSRESISTPRPLVR